MEYSMIPVIVFNFNIYVSLSAIIYALVFFVNSKVIYFFVYFSLKLMRKAKYWFHYKSIYSFDKLLVLTQINYGMKSNAVNSYTSSFHYTCSAICIDSWNFNYCLLALAIYLRLVFFHVNWLNPFHIIFLFKVNSD